MLTALGAAGVGVPSGAGALEEQTTNDPTNNTYGWILQHHDFLELDLGEPEVDRRKTQSVHLLDYLNAQWVEVGNPDPDGSTAGCWKHTFALSAVGAGVREYQEIAGGELQGPVLDDEQFSGTSIALHSDSEYVSVSKRRDPDLYNFIRGEAMESAMVGDDGYADLGLIETIAAEPNSYTTDNLGEMLYELRQSQEFENKVISSGVELVGLGMELWGGLAADAADFAGYLATAAGFLASGASGEEVIYPDEGSREGYSINGTAAGTGHALLFDVYVSPSETATFVLDSHFDTGFPDAYYPDDHENAGERRFIPDPTWEIEVAGPEAPESYDELTTSSAHFTATPLDGGETNVDLQLHQKGQPLAEFDIEDADVRYSTVRPGATMTLDAESSSSPDGPIDEYRWRIVELDGTVADPVEVEQVNEFTGVETDWIPSSGLYKIVLEVENWDGLTDERERVIAVTDVRDAELSISPEEPRTYLDDVAFDVDDAAIDHASVEDCTWTISRAPPHEETVVLESNGRSITHAFENAHDYKATAVIVDSVGARFEKSAQFTVTEPGEVGVSIAPDPVYPNSTVTFSATGFDHDIDGVRHNWELTNLDRGNTRVALETDVQPEFSYEIEESGDYNVQYRMRSDDELLVEAVETFTVDDAPPKPTVDIKMRPDPAVANEPIDLAAIAKDNDVYRIESYSEWSIRNATTNTRVRTLGEGRVQSTTLPAGEYRISLTVTDTQEQTWTYTESGFLVEEADGPDADFTMSPNPAEPDETISFDAGATTPGDGSLETFSWVIRDGTTQSKVDSMTGESPSTSLSAGEYFVILEVTDEHGKTSSEIQHGLEVEDSDSGEDPTGPDADFTMSPTPAVENETISFDAGPTTSGDGRIESYSWSIRNSTTYTEVRTMSGETASASLRAGEYQVTLEVTDDNGLSSTRTRYGLNVEEPDPPDASFSMSPDPAEADETISFDASATASGDGRIESYAWSIRDSTTQTRVRTMSGRTASTSLSAGEYYVKLEVTDENGLTSSDIQYGLDVEAPNRDPVARLSANKSDISFGEPVTFDASGSYDPDGSIAEYRWDGVSGSGAEVQTSFYSSGKKTATVTVVDDDGATDTASVTITVRI